MSHDGATVETDLRGDLDTAAKKAASNDFVGSPSADPQRKVGHARSLCGRTQPKPYPGMS